jgi:serine peptidase DegS
MKTRSPSLLLLLASVFWLGTFTSPTLRAQGSETFMSNLKIDKGDIDRRGSLPNTFAPVVKHILPAVVSISSARVTKRQVDPAWDVPQSSTQRQAQGLGSGVLVTKDGFIITNNHVIQGANEITVTLPTSQENYQAELIAADPSTDVALLKIDGYDLPQATMADSDLGEVGDVVLAVGNPFELNQSVTQGIISAKGRSNVGPGGNFYGNFIQTDASINPGNSGGALVDSSGRVIGINSMIYSTTGASSGIGFAIPINMALRVVRSLLDNGRVARGYLGVQLEDLSAGKARRLGRRELSGALVNAVVPDSPADRAGIRPNDLIVDYNGSRVKDRAKFRLDVSGTAPGERVVFGIVRNGDLLDVPVVLGEVSTNGAYVNRGSWDPQPIPGPLVSAV